MPDAEEALGDGLDVKNNPDLKPEESLNINVGWLLSELSLGNHNWISVEPTFFYRDTYNQILYQLAPGGTNFGLFKNIDKVRTYGTSLGVKYDYKRQIKLKGNVTYQQPRDWNEKSGTSKNLTYQDLLPNTPYFMTNGEIDFTKQDVFKKETEMTFFWDVQYVHSFYLYWPSLGNKNKSVIPSQLIHNTGISYSLKSGMYNISAGCLNLFNQQAYDNYRLQKPGRSFYLKFRIYLTKL